MGYNMKREFLLIHKELVNKFIELADSNGMASYLCETPQEASDTRYLFNNLLASLAAWEPSKAYVRKIIRTQLSFDEGTGGTILNIGVPVAGLKGRKPKVITPRQTVGTATAPPLTIDIITPENGTDVMFKLAQAKVDSVQTITFNTPPDATGIEFLTERLMPEYAPIDSTATPLVFERVR